MKKYPKRKNKLYKEIDILNIHKCNIECEFNIYQIDNTIYFNTNELVDGKCELNEALSRGIVKLNEFEKDNPQTTMSELLFDNEVVLTGEFKIYITFPIKNTSTFIVNTKKETTLKELINVLKIVYKHIYDVEYDTCTPITYTYVEKCSDCGVDYILNALSNKEKVDNKECVICLDDDKQTIKLDCGHIMHIDCLNEWVSRENNTCPICRDFINKCSECKGKLQIEKEFTEKIIPMEHRTGMSRNTTDGTFGIYGIDFERMYINRIFYNKTNNKIYLNF